jgi:hypothetical protein
VSALLEEVRQGRQRLLPLLRDLARLAKRKGRTTVKRKDAFRDRSSEHEVARATKPARLVSDEYKPMLIFSLTAEGSVMQSMTFRKEEIDYTHGCGWNFKQTGVTPEEFAAKYEELGFKVVTHPKPKRVNYNKSALVGRKVIPPTKLALEEMRQVVALRLEGKTYKEIEEAMGIVEKKGFWAMKILRRAATQ